MLNYAGEGVGAGTMPSAVPGGQLGPSPGGMAGPQPAMPIPAGPGQGMPGLLPSSMTTPMDQQYVAVTQEDGTILLHLKRPDGSLGPAVKIVNSVKPKQPSAAA